MNTINLGIIGLGNWGKKLATSLEQVDQVKLLTCFARTKEKRDSFSKQYNCESKNTLEEFLNDSRIQGVLIATPHSTHVDMIKAAAEAKKNIMVEKPLTLNSKDSRICLQAASRSNIILQVAHYRRLLPATRLAKAYISDGKLGKIHHFESNFSRPFGPDPDRPWRDKESEAPAGAFTALGVHMIDNLLYLGGDFEKVCALSTSFDKNTPLDDITTVMIKFKSGAHGIINSSLRLPFVASLSVHGDLASCWSEEDGIKFYTQKINEEKRIAISVSPINGVVENLKNFCDCVRNSKRPETSGDEGAKVVRILEAITESNQSNNRFIKV
ncbi:MAG: Gfo/Idh/MocA family oxidoreductase [Hyphomicrobiales bacterium]|nr:Gfo/Idh/MocA family oxidoreductase [Hyphomicrobiales bacterium]|tara:strand:+ start:858 stop:1838 length:981 start_codon:yes stop_codon:yes gene_type:complete